MAGEFAKLNATKPREAPRQEHHSKPIPESLWTRSREVPHHEHQSVDVDQQQDSLHSDRAGQREVDPLARCKLGRRRQEHRTEQHEEHRLQQLLEHIAGGNARGFAFGRWELDAQG